MSFSEKLRTEKLLSFTLVVLTLCVGILIGTLISVNWGVRAAKGNQAAPGATPLAIPNPVELSTAFSQIAKQVEPSVVNISTKYLPKAPARTQNRRRAIPAPGPVAHLVDELANDLEPAAERVEPKLVPFRDALEAAAGRRALLAGSGSSCWIPFEDPTEAGAARARVEAALGLRAHLGLTMTTAASA